MNYSDYLGDFVQNPKTNGAVLIEKDQHVHINDLIDRPRLGIPLSSINYDENIEYIRRVKDVYIKKGYYGGIPQDMPLTFRSHLMYFRANLDVYDELIQHKVFSKEELYFRCLDEGPSFAEFIKKTRAYSLQDKICIGENNSKQEYVAKEYSGYDSILHERYLINWDNCDETVDWPYSLLESNNSDIDYITPGWSKLMVRYKLCKEKTELVRLFEPVANKKSSTLEGMKTTLLKNTWSPEERGGTYFATRKVIPIEAGNVRDTGVPDVESLCKLKLLHQHTRFVSENLPYSANCNFTTLNQRLQRLRRKETFVHLDFKKFGLTFPRKAVNRVLEMLDLKHLIIDDFVLRCEDGDIRTNRGGVLGWFDATVALSTIAILTHLAEKEGWVDFDMLQFNDDIEVGFGDLPEPELRYRVDKMLKTLAQHDFIMSYRKSYSSRESIFLEDYDGFDRLDMVKMQLAVRFFAKSISTEFRWEAKLMFSMGRNFGYTRNIEKMCFENIYVSRDDEFTRPVELGGWIFKGSEGLNDALLDADENEMLFFIKMKKYKEPHIMPKYVDINIEKLLRRKQYTIAEATGPVDYHKDVISLDDNIDLSQLEVEATDLMRGLGLPSANLPPLPPRPKRRINILEPD